MEQNYTYTLHCTIIITIGLSFSGHNLFTDYVCYNITEHNICLFSDIIRLSCLTPFFVEILKFSAYSTHVKITCLRERFVKSDLFSLIDYGS